jgi:hypothetical protein
MELAERDYFGLAFYDEQKTQVINILFKVGKKIN